MSLLFKVSDKEVLSIRNKIYTEVGIPELEQKGFVKLPFSSWFGINNLGDYTYELCRLSQDSQIEFLITQISTGDKYIKIFLNIFKLSPKVNSIEQLKGYNNLNDILHSNRLTEMRLRSDEYKGPPLFYMIFCPEHKIGNYCSKKGFDREVEKLQELIKKDMNNIDTFIQRWHQLYQINQIILKIN